MRDAPEAAAGLHAEQQIPREIAGVGVVPHVSSAPPTRGRPEQDVLCPGAPLDGPCQATQ
jgi:hypothetical protein